MHCGSNRPAPHVPSDAHMIPPASNKPPRAFSREAAASATGRMCCTGDIADHDSCTAWPGRMLPPSPPDKSSRLPPAAPHCAAALAAAAALAVASEPWAITTTAAAAARLPCSRPSPTTPPCCRSRRQAAHRQPRPPRPHSPRSHGQRDRQDRGQLRWRRCHSRRGWWKVVAPRH